MFPCKQAGKGVPGDQAGQALAQGFLSDDEPETGHEPKEQTRYRWPSESIGNREGQMVVVAEHSTCEGGEVRPKRPIRGKARSGIARYWQERRETGL